MSSSFLIRKKYFEDLGTANVPKFLVGKKTTEHTYSTCSDTVALELGITLHPGEGTVEKDHITLTAGSKFTQPEVVPPGIKVLDSWYKDAGFTMPATDGTRVDITFSNLYANFIELDDCTIFETVSGTSLAYFNNITLDSKYDKFFVDWGDGNLEKFTTSRDGLTHDYAVAGKYTIKISKLASSINITGNSSTNRRIEKIIGFSSNITKLPQYFCRSQTSLREANLNGIKTIGNLAFNECTNAEFTNYENANTYDTECFRKCDGITEFHMGTYPAILNTGWLRSSLLTSITVDPANTKFSDLGKNVIYDKQSRKIDAACKNSDLNFASYDVTITRFSRCLYGINAPDKDLILPAGYNYATSYEFEDVVLKSIDMSNCTELTSIGSFQYMFKNANLSESIILPPNLKELGYYAFQDVKGNGFATITLPSSFRKFNGNSIFASPSNGAIKKVIFLNSEFESTIGEIFYRCNELTEISFEAIVDSTKIPTLSNLLFNSGATPSNLVIYVADEAMKTAFENATNWNKYAGRYQIRGQ